MSRASTGLCGGCRVTDIPTATSRLLGGLFAGARSLGFETTRSVSVVERGAASKGGCSQDWLPHADPFTPFILPATRCKLSVEPSEWSEILDTRC